jgi:adenosylmethionine-8-amino-7-oxononanoate aminotransferase
VNRFRGDLMPRSHLIKPSLDGSYPIVDYGKGVYVYDKEGKKYLDASSGAVTANIGHGMEEILQAMVYQAKKISFVYRSQFSSEPAEELAEWLDKKTGYPWSFFVNSGSEAVETAIKIAIQHWQEKGQSSKRRILSRWLSYHGITFGALSASGHPLRRERFDAHIGDWPVIEPPYCYECPFQETYPGCGLKCATQLETMINRIGSNNIAAFIAEPIVGAAAGAIAPPDEYYKVIKDICVKYDILFISDEVMTGCGRTGTFLALEQWGVEADIVAIGKGLSAGYSPIAATLASDAVLEPIVHGSKVIMSGHTFSGNPLSSAAALSVLKLIDSERIIDAVKEKGNYLTTLLKKLQDQFSFVGDIRGRGLLIGLEFTSNESMEVDAAFTATIVKKAQQNGLLLYPAGAGIDGRKGAAIIVAPPLTISKSEMEEIYSKLKTVFTLLKKQQEDKEDG